MPAVNRQAVQELAAALHVQPLTARVLANRGFSDPKAAQRFLAPSLDHLHDPLALTGMREAVARLTIRHRSQGKNPDLRRLRRGRHRLGGDPEESDRAGRRRSGAPRAASAQGRLRHALGSDRARRGHGRPADRERRHRHSRTGSRARRPRAGHRRHHHRSSSAGSRAAARARGPESEPPRFELSRQESLRRRRGVQAGAGAARDAELAGRKAGAHAQVVSQAGGGGHGGRRRAAGGRKSRHRQIRPRGFGSRAKSGVARAAGSFRTTGRPRPERPPGCVSDRPAHQRRRPHGRRRKRHPAISNGRLRVRPEAGRAASTRSTRSARRPRPTSCGWCWKNAPKFQ